MFLVKNALQKNQIQFLNTINNEVKVQQSTKLLILKKMNVMSYKDLKKAWVKCADKETVKEVKDKNKCDQKHKSSVLKTNILKSNVKMMWMSKVSTSTKALVVQISETSVTKDEIVSESWRA